MFEPLFKKQSKPSKGPSCCKTAAPIALIRKVAAELGPTKEEREKSLDLEEKRLSKRVVKDKGRGAGIGALSGLALGGIAGGIAGGKDLRALAVPGAYAGALLGAGAGMALGGDEKTRAAADRLEQIGSERQQLSAMKPESRGPLTDENLDRETYHQARAEAAQARLDMNDASKPLVRGSLAGTGLGALAGGVVGHRLGGVPGALHLAPRGALLGSMAGLGVGAALSGEGGRRRMSDAANRLHEASSRRDSIWQGASTLENAPVQDIRKAAAALAFEDLTGPAPVSTEEILRQEKLASVADQELFQIASSLEPDVDGALSTYETLGGTYKLAFGTPMFNTQQLAGSPALSGGMAQRAAKPTVSVQQAQPTQSPATASPRAQAQGASTPSAPAQTSAPSAAPAAASAPAVSVSMG